MSVALTQARRSRPNGWWGMAMLVATESTLFAVLIGSYFYLRFQAVVWPPPGEPHPKPLVPLVLAAVLVSTSVPMHIASAAAAAGDLERARLGLGAALVVGSGYLAMQMVRFVDALGRLEPKDGAYPSIVTLLSGGHHAHVLPGLLLNAWLLLRLRSGLTPYRANGIEAAALYWYFIDALAVAVTLTILSPAL